MAEWPLEAGPLAVVEGCSENLAVDYAALALQVIASPERREGSLRNFARMAVLTSSIPSAKFDDRDAPGLGGKPSKGRFVGR